MGRFSRSIELAKASWKTLKQDRELLWLPVLSFIGALLVVGVFGGMVFLIDSDLTSSATEEASLSAPSIILLVIMGMALSIVATFFQAAMVGGAHERLTGGDPTVSSALASATSRLGVIIPWALFSWTVGMVLRAVEENFGVVGKIVSSMLGMAFRVVTFLAIPVLVVERMGPIATLKRSGELLKRSWGENLIAQVGLGIISFIALIAGIIPAVIIATALSPVVGIVLGLIWVAIVVTVTTSLTAIYQTALYEYVTTNEIPTNFENADLTHAFKLK